MSEHNSFEVSVSCRLQRIGRPSHAYAYRTCRYFRRVPASQDGMGHHLPERSGSAVFSLLAVVSWCTGKLSGKVARARRLQRRRYQSWFPAAATEDRLEQEPPTTAQRAAICRTAVLGGLRRYPLLART